MMKRLIDCRFIVLEQFKIEQGYQPNHALLYITRGEVEFSIQDKKEHAEKNTLISFPDYICFKRKITHPAEFYLIRYEEENDRTLPVGKILVEDKNRLLSTIQYLMRLNDVFGEQQVKDAFLADIFNQIKAETMIANIQKDRVVAVVHYFFEKNLQRKISLNETACVACLSGSGLIAHFKRYVGITPMEYLSTLRLKRAESLLCRTEQPIAQIAAQCGFESPYYFSNSFKKYYGLSPRNYRQKHRI